MAAQDLAAADEAFGRGDFDGVIAHLSSAIRNFTAEGDKCAAAMACARLGSVMANILGNGTAARAWFARAWRLIENEPPCIEQGWVAVAAMGCDVDDPAKLLSAAELALDRARAFGDVNLETKALADAGLAHVQSGRIDDGMALLDEAMALACGPADKTVDGTSASVCSFFTACYYTADFGRANTWTDPLRQAGLIAQEFGTRMYLSSHCDSVQATMLIELGRWSDAEALLVRGREVWAATMGIPGYHLDIVLADLRTRQGRLAEAEQLLFGREHHLDALLPAARLHLARGDHELAAAMATRALRALGDDRLRAIAVLTVLVDAALGLGDVDGAAAWASQLTERVNGVDLPALAGRAAAAHARALAAQGKTAEAIALLEEAVDHTDVATQPLLRATLLTDLATIRERVGDNAGAAIDAKTASALLATLDVGPFEVEIKSAGVASMRRDGKWWTVTDGATSVRVPDTKGLRYLAALIARPGVERHALDLVDQVEGVALDLDRRSLGDAGELLDTKARTLYRHRIEELRTKIDEALETGMLETAEATQGELDILMMQLGAAFGLGGQDRKAASAAERARLNVTRALRAAITKLAEALPEAGAVLDRRVRTGLYCAYEPDPSDAISWTSSSVQS